MRFSLYPNSTRQRDPAYLSIFDQSLGIKSLPLSLLVYADDVCRPNLFAHDNFYSAPGYPQIVRLKTGQSIRVEDCPLLVELHAKKKDTPTMGGIFILSSMLVSLIIWMDWKSSFTLILLVTTVWLGFLGGYDDYLKLKYKNSKGHNALKQSSCCKICSRFLSPSIFSARGITSIEDRHLV